MFTKYLSAGTPYQTKLHVLLWSFIKRIKLIIKLYFRSSETEHPKECIGNIKRTTCLICKERIKAGHIKSRQDMDRQHKMHENETQVC